MCVCLSGICVYTCVCLLVYCVCVCVCMCVCDKPTLTDGHHIIIWRGVSITVNKLWAGNCLLLLWVLNFVFCTLVVRLVLIQYKCVAHSLYFSAAYLYHLWLLYYTNRYKLSRAHQCLLSESSRLCISVNVHVHLMLHNVI